MSGPILVFDSGVGGLSVVAALRRQLPDAGLAYVCDNAMLPYGLREDAWLVERILRVCRAAVESSACAGLVVACNTASTLALEPLRKQLAVPVVGTVPAIKPAAGMSETRHIGLLATSATVGRPYTSRLIEQFAGDCHVTRIAADPLVAEAERWVMEGRLDSGVLRDVLSPLGELPSLDTLVLGCTHFPLLKQALAEATPHPLRWVDSGDAIARRAGQVMQGHDPQAGRDRAWISADNDALHQGLRRFGFQRPEALPLS
ncbi:glutamate racemase [Halomonas sp. 18H]|uniref:glutamate racemase n=1 Tax=Halomonas almeriensis TaxID=308163 RepID=UPI00222EF520|nr:MULTISPECIES: glutamate racemase [Halomonas]MCW4149128.1 glutamate racemase [Halomonas sp. 18H]MDN3552321.1 glutamate racemase [Halomonas almeriensis]